MGLESKFMRFYLALSKTIQCEAPKVAKLVYTANNEWLCGTCNYS
jgi:hypothetical protein